MRTSICILMACAIAATTANTAGRRFHLVFMENIVEAPQDGPLEVHVSNTQSVSATVTVSSPGTSCPPQTLTISANSAGRFDVCWWMRLVAYDYWPSQKTVLVESTQDVMVYAYNKELYSADGYFAIPTDELAETYYLAAYDEANLATQFAISALSEVDIQVTLPSTALPVEVNYQGLRYTNGDKFTMHLSQYETYLAQSRGDVSGARISASAPIAVFSGNIRNKQDSGSRDHLVAQLMPVGDWGTQFYTQPVPRTQNFGDVLRVFGKKLNTGVTIQFSNGNSVQRTLTNPGDYYEFSASGPVAILAQDSAKPLQVIQMVRSQDGPRIQDVADPAMFMLVSRNMWLNEYISPSLRYSRDGNAYRVNYALISIVSGQRGGIRVNGNTISVEWTEVNGISSAWVTVGSGNNRFTHFNGQSFMVMVYGASDRESYAFALGADMSNSACQESLSVLGDQRDNDCDNVVDEEDCDGIDNDGDGLIDEDCDVASVEAFGNSYMIMFMENNVDDNPNAQSFLEIYMSNVDSSATVSYGIWSEEFNWSNGTIVNEEVKIIDGLDPNLQQRGSGTQSKGIRIIADGDIIVYGVNKQTWSTDAFLAFPTDVVGLEYYTAHYWPGTDLNEFGIAAFATDGPTSIEVTMPTNIEPVSGGIASSGVFGGQTIGPGGSITISLNYGQTAQFQAASANDNLNGAHIVSDKPISVFSGNVRARVDPVSANSRDHLVHQLAPVDTWGVEFVTMPAPRSINIGDKFTVTASQGSTTVVVDVYMMGGGSNRNEYALGTAGSTVTFDVASDAYARIQSNRPIQVVQYVKTTTDRNNDDADPAMMLYPPVEQWSRNYAFVTPRTGQPDPASPGQFLAFNNFVMIAIDTNQRNGLRLDGSGLPGNPNWVSLVGTPYSATFIQVSSGRHTLSHIDDAVFFEAIMYGRSDRESYGLPLGMRLVARGCEPTTMTEGDGLDNDCDGSIDEELCNEIDDDADGVVDEDCGAGLSSGTSFYLTYMDNVVESPRDFDLELYVAVVGQSSAIVNVRAPLYDFPVYNSMIEVQPGDVQSYGFTWRMRNEGQGVTGKTVFVRANSDVVVYGVNKELFSNDGFLVYPENSLGTSYYTVSWSPSTLQTEFAIVATVDNTQVTIRLPNSANLAVEYNGQTFSAGQQFTINLDRFQVYQAQSNGDLTGSRITSNQRVAVFSGNVRTLVELSASRDHLVQQMLPTTSYGSEYYIVPFPDRTVGDMIRIMAASANTQISINGQNEQTIQAGGYYQRQINSGSTYRITSSNPVMIVQFSKSQDGKDNPEKGDPAMFIVPSVTNFVDSATFITPVYSGGNTPGSDYTNYLTVVMVSGQQGNLRLNNSPVNNAGWSSVSNSNYVFATLDVPSGRAHTLTTTSGAQFYGRLYGRADRETYAFAVGMRF